MSMPDEEAARLIAPDAARLIDEEAEHAEVTREDPHPPGVVAERRNRIRSTVYSIRLSDDEVTAIQRLADSAGVPSSTLVRSWIIEQLIRASASRARVDPAMRQVIHAEVRAAVREAFNETKQQAA
jgi:predicted transcriptional regulator